MFLRYLSVLAVAGTYGLACVAQAAEPLRLQEAVARAMATNPALRAEASELQAVEARAARESLATPYTVSTELENLAGTGTLSGINSAESTLRIGRVIELGGKRAARQALGQAQISQQENLAQIARIDIASRTATRFIAVVAEQRRIAQAQERLEQAERTRQQVEQWVKAARNPEPELRAAEIAVADAQLQLERAQFDLNSARSTLASTWGALTPDFTEVAGDLATLPPVEPFDTLAARLPMSPEQRASLLEAETIAARRRMAQAAAKPDVNVSLGVRRLQAVNDNGLVMSFSVPLGNKPRSTFSLAEANAQLAAVEARREASQFERHQLLFEKYQQLKQAHAESEALSARMLPKAEEALAFTRRGFEAGRFSFLSLAQAQNTLFDLRGRAVDAAARYHILLAEVERLSAVVPEIAP